jgi:short-subunit dehydrogenase
VSAFAPRHALITGAAGAIGGGIARILRRRFGGVKLSLADVDPRIDHIAGELDGTALRWDLSDPASIDSACEALIEERGPIDLLVNCAGIMEVRSFARMPWRTAERLMNIDLISPLRLMSIVAASMVERREGTIVNVSSMAGVTPIRGCSFYGASKAGLAMASEIARLDLAPGGVHVMTVYPGPVRSELERRARAQLPSSLVARWIPMGDPDALAARIVDGCVERKARVVYPPLYEIASRFPTIAGGFTSMFSPVPRDA